LKNYNDLGKLL